MIHEIASTLPSFKTVRLRHGFNLLLAEKTRGASKEQTRNAAGKSSLLEIIHFLLGSEARQGSLFTSDALREEAFRTTFDLFGGQVTVERSVLPEEEKNRFYIFGELGSLATREPEYNKAGEPSFALKPWRQLLGEAFFGLPTDESYHPKFRSLISYFCRRSSEGGFLAAQSHSKRQQPWDSQVNLAWLLGLNWRIPADIEKLRKERQELDRLKTELKGSGVVGQLVGTSSRLQAELTLHRHRAEQLERQLTQFRVLPEYEQVEKEASGLAIGIAELANENTLDRQLIRDIDASLTSEQPPESTTVTELYEAAGVQLPDMVKKRLEEVSAFHEAVVRNRRSHLEAERQRAERRIADRQSQAHEMESRQVELMKLLQTHGALEQYTAFQNEHQRLRAEALALEKRLAIARRIETGGADLAVRKAELERKLMLDLEERAPIVEEATILFGEISRRLSEKSSILEIAHDEKGLRFEISGGPNRSDGIKHLEIFCFDMMLAILAGRRGVSPGFLIHDSYLFDPLEERQIATALEIGAELSAEYHFQYLVTLNSDRLPRKELSSRLDLDAAIIEPRLTDATDDGGLFGMRFV